MPRLFSLSSQSEVGYKSESDHLKTNNLFAKMSHQAVFPHRRGAGLSTPRLGQGRSHLRPINFNNTGGMSQVTFSSATSKETVAEKHCRLQSDLSKLNGGDVYDNEDEDDGVAMPNTLEGVVSEAEMRQMDGAVARERVLDGQVSRE
jgi:hypothetical protein